MRKDLQCHSSRYLVLRLTGQLKLSSTLHSCLTSINILVPSSTFEILVSIYQYILIWQLFVKDGPTEILNLAQLLVDVVGSRTVFEVFVNVTAKSSIRSASLALSQP